MRNFAEELRVLVQKTAIHAPSGRSISAADLPFDPAAFDPADRPIVEGLEAARRAGLLTKDRAGLQRPTPGTDLNLGSGSRRPQKGEQGKDLPPDLRR